MNESNRTLARLENNNLSANDLFREVNMPEEKNKNPVNPSFDEANKLREELWESAEFLVRSEIQTALEDYRSSNKKFKDENEILKKENESLKKENEILKKENEIYQDGFKALEDKLNGKNPSIVEIKELLQKLKSKLAEFKSK